MKSKPVVDIRDARGRVGKSSTLARKRAPFSPKRKGRGAHLNKGPAGNKFAETHGFYTVEAAAEERRDREAMEQALIEDLGGASAISASQRTLIRTAGMLEMRRARVDRAIQEGRDAPAQEHVLALVNSLRLTLCALGLERQAKPGRSLQDYIRQRAHAGGISGVPKTYPKGE
jgi:hypothetical protein